RSLVNLLSIKRGDCVLDVGTGTGLLLPYLLASGPAKVIACDLSREMLRIAAGKHGASGVVEFLHADAGNLPLPDGAVDVIVCNGVYPHFNDRRATLMELHRVAAPGARLAISHFGGRDFVNRVHASSDNEAVRGDLLETSGEVACLMEACGFATTQVIDTPELFLVAGVKRG
ncbi:MAG TPA: class I SAM-dependent methyltransferase, partial [Firmicutes bacterium]|nr:class I SAM-dependent methyltransferase [Bacillota bacterium]